MKFLFVGAILLLSSCSSQPFSLVDKCGVPGFDGELANGLIRVAREIEGKMRAQLPDNAKKTYFCWYQKRNGKVQALNFDLHKGYIFELIDGEWKFVSEEDYIFVQH